MHTSWVCFAVNEARPHATAWFPPLPPAVTLREVAVRVSPGPGQRGVLVTKSMFREPIMLIFGLIVGVGVVVSLRPGILEGVDVEDLGCFVAELGRGCSR